MLPFRKILCPVDYSAPCEAVVPFAKDLLRHFQAELVLLHAYGPASITPFAYNEFAMTDPNLYEEVMASELERLRTFASEMFPGQHAECMVELGEPGCVIHKVARREAADLVMLATHGHGPLRRFLLGSVTAKVLHDLGTPVWTGAGSALTGHAPAIPYGSILCALDNSDEAVGVLKAAAALAEAYEAELSILHVVEIPAPVPEVDFAPIKEQLLDAAHFRLREMKATLGVNAPHTVLESPIADAINHEVLRRQADLVVTGRGHAQGGLSRMWSHLYSIVRESPCPVISI